MDVSYLSFYINLNFRAAGASSKQILIFPKLYVFSFLGGLHTIGGGGRVTVHLHLHYTKKPRPITLILSNITGTACAVDYPIFSSVFVLNI